MNSNETVNIFSEEIPTKIFKEFLKELASQGISAVAIDRFRSAMLEDKDFSEATLMKAVFADDSTL